jgi:hypothetical protein
VPVLPVILASQHDAGTVYVAYENHQNGDFKPYFFKSVDRGKTWKSITGNLPVNGPVMSFAEDHVNPNLLFAGTEYGVFFTVDGGEKWIRLRGGLPTIQIRDMTIQRRENDLVLGTFGRGFYVLDDYSPLRTIKPETLKEEAVIFPIKPTVEYIQSSPLGGRGNQQSDRGPSHRRQPIQRHRSPLPKRRSHAPHRAPSPGHEVEGFRVRTPAG